MHSVFYHLCRKSSRHVKKKKKQFYSSPSPSFSFLPPLSDIFGIGVLFPGSIYSSALVTFLAYIGISRPCIGLLCPCSKCEY